MATLRIISLFFIFTLLCLAAGCATTTKNLSTWKDPSFNKAGFSNVVVICAAANEGNRRIFEDEFVRQLQKNNINATASYTMFTLNDGKDGDAVKELIKKRGFDSVLVGRMVDKTTEMKYYPPTVTYTGPPRAYYGGWYNYYHMGYSYSTTPGHTSTQDIVKLECNVYDTATEKLVFSSLSSTTITRGSKTKVDSVVKVILNNILK